MVLIKPAGIPHCAKIVRCAWENSEVSLSVQDFHRLHFEIVTSAAASIPKEVRAYPEGGSGPVSQALLERGLCLDLFIYNSLTRAYRTLLVNFMKTIVWSTHYYNDVIMSEMGSQITSISTVCSTIYSGADQRKHQSSASLAFVGGIHRWPVNSSHKRPVTRKMLSFDDVIMRWVQDRSKAGFRRVYDECVLLR